MMQFDHLDASEKEFNISQWAVHSLDYKLLKEEMEKCDLVCANCHSVRTYFRKLSKRNENNVWEYKKEILTEDIQSKLKILGSKH